jgi:hypothetical protein
MKEIKMMKKMKEIISNEQANELKARNSLG